MPAPLLAAPAEERIGAMLIDDRDPLSLKNCRSR
jgi:hypothetical protein